ncbi:hypothetical protein OZX67_06090 [Bifidobacterium sp. ESL0728]|uniref:5-methylcytosine restriction system specificity protein McrC n=1 Tax=Bifidobacterium sp. ESL0728 TaxID=2983220 RepID=UPI0023F7A5B0|nr:hypothetical protein [Bifidobacterium sp. ESL0728]WEV58397.1 hypothetical protein OZX67_06090 [Bifidobacterium sp. ESL0728]
MRAEDHVVIKNIYYMMTYAFKALKFKQYSKLQTEDFETIDDLMAAILAIGLSTQRKRGFEREYQPRCEWLHDIRGRIDMADTARLKMGGSNEISCVYDDLSADTYKNRILKTTARLLIDKPGVDTARRHDLKRCLIGMGDVQFADVRRVDWARLRFDRNNASYQLLMNVCRMVLERQLLTQSQGTRKMSEYDSQRQLSNLYEKFVLKYYQQRFAGEQGMTIRAKEINRRIESDEPTFLPTLQTDVTLHQGDKTLIIDTKCYGQILQAHFNGKIYRPKHINQIQSYVLHEAYGNDDEVSGMLLYALTDNDNEHDETWRELGHRFSVRTLDLGQNFRDITAELNDIVERWMR